MPPLPVLLDAIPASRQDIAAHLGITNRTLKAWVNEEKAPRHILVALFLESSYGRQTIHSDLYNEAQDMRGLQDCLRRECAMLRARIERLESLAQFGSANEPYISRAL